MKIEYDEKVHRKFLGLVQSSVEGPILLDMSMDGAMVSLKVAGNVVYTTSAEHFEELTVPELMERADLTKKR